jgi:hypothetical protein
MQYAGPQSISGINGSHAAPNHRVNTLNEFSFDFGK